MAKEKREMAAYSLLLLYYLIIAGMCDSATIGLLLGIAVGDIIVIFIYRVFGEKSMLYAHFFVALLAAMIPHIYSSGIYAWDIVILYATLTLIFAHFVLLRFSEYEKIHSITYMLYASSLLLAMVTVILLLYFPIHIGTVGIAALVLVMILLYYILSRPTP